MTSIVPRTSDEVRDAFLGFFEERSHLLLSGSPLVPIGDPTSLFTSAGMQQFKPYFMGESEPPSLRVTTVQRCFRTTDIEEVGDLSHCTAFEMLGNFSFGDYSKEGAIDFAWELLTGVFQMPPERLHVTVFETDDEAFELWRSKGVPEERIHRYGEKSNYWFSFPSAQPGASGPCGPDSEIFFDHFPERGGGVGPEDDEERFLEIWNIVFMELYQRPDGEREPLPSKNIDTGSGLERVVAVQQGKQSVFETDAFLPIIAAAAAAAGIDYFGPDASESERYAIRAMSEHCRAAALLIGDGVVPSNEGRGYVLRRIIRRAIYFARQVGVTNLFTTRLADAAIDKLKSAYPHLEEQREFIHRALSGEEERFIRTLNAGGHRLDLLIDRLREQRESVIPGSDVFLLYDTFGFPRELVREIAEREGFAVDESGFEEAMESQRRRAREHGLLLAGEVSPSLASLGEGHSDFVGYARLDEDSAIAGILKDGELVDLATPGSPVEVVLTSTPFYPEGGGQVGDQGILHTSSGQLQVEDTQATGGAIAHRGRVLEGELTVGQAVQASVDGTLRVGSARNHTGTHLLHAALRSVLGRHVKQQGSLVAPERLRFDFTSLEQTPREALVEVQQLVNEKVRRNLEVDWRRTSFREAEAAGALAFFGDKYGDEVRVVEIADGGSNFSAELCGGTHVEATGELGFIYVIRESAVAAGTRRIEALTGSGAEAFLMEQQTLLERLSQRLSTNASGLEQRIEALQSDLEQLRRQSEDLQHDQAASLADSLVAAAKKIGSSSLVAERVDVPAQDILKEIADGLRANLGSALVILAAAVNGRPAFLVAVTPDLVSQGLNAGNIVREVAKAAGGGGGGRPDIAQAGARDASRIDEALEVGRGLGEQALLAL